MAAMLASAVERGFMLLILWASVTGSRDDGKEKRQIHYTETPRPPHTPAPSDPLAAWMSSTANSKPNVLFLIADDLRPKLGCYGETNMVTPNLDHLATKSVMFKQAFAQVALCGPSRASFLTGRRADTTRVFDLHTYFRTAAGNFTTLPQFFKNHGYYTQSVGKIFHPGASSGDNDKLYSWSAHSYEGDDPIPSNSNHIAAVHPVNETETGNLVDTNIADFAVNFLRDRTFNQNQPFFLAVGFHKPHLPFLFPKEYLDLYPLSNIHLAKHRTRPSGMPHFAWSGFTELRKFQDVAALANSSSPDFIIPDDFQKKLRQGYSAATTYMDAQLGRVLQALTQYGFAGNTIVSFLGDHGWHLGDNAEWCKHTNFEMALHIPMMLYVPGVTSVGHQYDFINPLAPGFQNHPHGPGSQHVASDLVEAVDLYPTLAELSGLNIPSTCPPNSVHVPTCTEGTSLVPLIRKVRGHSPNDHMQWKDAAYSQYIRNRLSTRPVMGYSVRTKTHRYTEWVVYDKVHYQGDFTHVLERELYQHSSDPYEFHNLAEDASQQSTVAQLSQILHNGWRTTLNNYLGTLH